MAWWERPVIDRRGEVGAVAQDTATSAVSVVDPATPVPAADPTPAGYPAPAPSEATPAIQPAPAPFEPTPVADPIPATAEPTPAPSEPTPAPSEPDLAAEPNPTSRPEVPTAPRVPVGPLARLVPDDISSLLDAPSAAPPAAPPERSVTEASTTLLAPEPEPSPVTVPPGAAAATPSAEETAALSASTSVAGVLMSALIDPATGTVAQAAGSVTDGERLAAAAGMVLRAQVEVCELLGVEAQVEDISVNQEHRNEQWRPLREDRSLYLYVLVDPDHSNPAMVRVQLTKVITQARS